MGSIWSAARARSHAMCGKRRSCASAWPWATATDEKHKIAAKVLAMVRPECYLHIHDTWKKSDKNKLKERLLAPHGAAPIQQARAPKLARVASLVDDEDDSQLLVQRDTSSRGRSLKRPARMRDE